MSFIKKEIKQEESKMSDEKIVEYRGIRNLVAAKITKDGKDSLTYETPFYLAGTSELSKETASSSDTH